MVGRTAVNTSMSNTLSSVAGLDKKFKEHQVNILLYCLGGKEVDNELTIKIKNLNEV